jgi:hypothetical protein
MRVEGEVIGPSPEKSIFCAFPIFPLAVKKGNSAISQDRTSARITIQHDGEMAMAMAMKYTSNRSEISFNLQRSFCWKGIVMPRFSAMLMVLSDSEEGCEEYEEKTIPCRLPIDKASEQLEIPENIHRRTSECYVECDP